jgi:hypothetical protein
MKLNELEKLLSISGYSLDRINKHRIWTKPSCNPIAVPSHRLVNKMVAKKIIKELNRGDVHV